MPLSNQPDCSGCLSFASMCLPCNLCRCINATEGLLLSKPIPAGADAAFFCNRYKIVDGGAKVGHSSLPHGVILHCSAPFRSAASFSTTRPDCGHDDVRMLHLRVPPHRRDISSLAQVKVVAAVQLGSYPECPDGVIDKADLDAAPALVSSAGTYSVVGETQLPSCG